jgi:hypothetical protein
LSSRSDAPLIGDKRSSQRHRGDRHRNAKLGVNRLRSHQQALHRANCNEDRGNGNQDHLHQRRQGLGFAMSEAMLVIGWSGRNSNGEQDNQARDQIQSAVGERAEHRG